MRKFPGRSLVVVVAASVLVLAGAACSKERDSQNTKVFSGVVATDKPTTHTFGDMTVTVPAGAVAKESKLTATAPTPIEIFAAPLGMRSVKFDLSLEHSGTKVQPVKGKPLEVKIKLKGGFLPEGANPLQALFYTRTTDGKGYSLIPSVVQDGVLQAKVPHLSEKEVAYLDVAGLEALVGRGIDIISRPECRANLTTRSTGDIRLGRREGWAATGDTPILACLYENGGQARLSIANHANYILSVAATDGLKLSDSAKDLEEGLVMVLARHMFPNKRIKAFLGRNGELTAPLSLQQLPARVELRGDPNTFLAEAAWFSLKFVVGIFVGEKGDGLAQKAKRLIEATEVVDCLTNATKTANGSASFWDIIGLVTSKCTEIIANEIGTLVAADFDAWKAFWDRFFVIGEGVVGGWNTLASSYNGIMMQFRGTIAVNVVPEYGCPSKAEVLASESKYFDEDDFPDGRPVSTVIRPIVCQDGWAITVVNHSSSYGDSIGVPLLRWQKGEWVTLTYGSDPNDKCMTYGSQLPPKIRDYLHC